MNIRGVPRDEGKFERAARVGREQVGAAQHVDWSTWPDWQDIRLIVNSHEYEALRPFLQEQMEQRFAVSTPVETDWLYERDFGQKKGGPLRISDPNASSDRVHMSRRGFYWPGED